MQLELSPMSSRGFPGGGGDVRAISTGFWPRVYRPWRFTSEGCPLLMSFWNLPSDSLAWINLSTPGDHRVLSGRPRVMRVVSTLASTPRRCPARVLPSIRLLSKIAAGRRLTARQSIRSAAGWTIVIQGG